MAEAGISVQWKPKANRMKLRHPEERNLPALLHRIDSVRTHYTKTYYGHDWSDRGLYHLCVNSTLGIDACATLIVQTISSSAQSEDQIDPRRDEKGIDAVKKS